MTQNTLSDATNRIVKSLCEYFDWDINSEQTNEVRKAIRYDLKYITRTRDLFDNAIDEQNKRASAWLGKENI